MTIEGDRTVFRPSRARFRPVWRYGMTTVGGLAAFLVLVALVSTGGDVLRALAVLVPLAVLIGGPVCFVLALDVRPRIVIGPDEVIVRRLTRGRVTARSQVGTAVLTTESEAMVGWVSNPHTSGIRLYLLRVDGSRMANLAEEFWGLDQFDQITRALGVEVDHVGSLTPKQLRRRYRGAVPWCAAHVATTVILCVIAGVTVLPAAIFALAALFTVVF